MKIDSKSKICGLSIKQIRDFLKKHRFSRTFNGEMVSEHFGITSDQARTLIDELLKLGYVVVNENGNCMVTTKGNALCLTKFIPRINRQKADKIFSEFMQRVEEVNNDDKFLLRVKELVLFGSYLDPERDDYGDIDIAYELERKIEDEEEYEERVQELVDEFYGRGRYFSNVVDEICYPENLVLTHLRNRNSYISLHRTFELPRLSCPSKQVYPAE